MVNTNVVVMDGPGPFYFGRLEGPLRLLPATEAHAVGIEGQMEVNETGRRVVVRIPLAEDDALQLLELLKAFQRGLAGHPASASEPPRGRQGT